MRRNDDLLIEVAVEQLLVHDLRGGLGELSAFFSELVVAHILRHAFRALQRTDIPSLHLAVGAIVFDVHRVMLAALHGAVRVAVPAALHPAEGHGPADVGPQAFKEFVIAAELPVAIDFHDAAELPVRRRQEGLLRTFQREVDTEAHETVVASRMHEFRFAHVPRQRAKQKCRCLFVIPHMRAGTVAGAPRIAAAFPTVEIAVSRTEHRLRAQRRNIEQRGFFHFRRQRRCAERVHERQRARLQFRQAAGHFGRRRPRRREAFAIVVADDVRIVVRLDILPRFGGQRRPCAAVRETPRQHECERLFAVGGNHFTQAEGAFLPFIDA